MNPEVQKQVLAWMASLQTAVEKGAEFVVGQAPGVVQEIVAYGKLSARQPQGSSLCLF